ncbi:YfhO family protein [Chryseolinea lacunae]|uniref:YfhO family protein n=1 Tax=Chryseolinea lacunae TaxID=2801331 RepID=A0ABS1KTN3_9BACT|nr:YfhO family protein [Chryseolinea lacunae]MBL0742779.1 YfhO family protein [Chryseolinea lacunae]
MKKINFAKDVLPHGLAIGVFLIVTFFFFNPVFFDHKVIAQHDIQQWEGSSKASRDYREKTGEEPLWTEAMFSGMPAYLVNVQWGNTAVAYLKSILSFRLPHPVCNIYLAFLSYYILLLAFGVRPYLAIAGAVAFGLSSYMIIGLSAGHNGRIGAIAFMPLVIAGIHLAFSGKRFLGFGVTTAAMALHFRENHLQITYYMLLIVLVYGVIQLVQAVKTGALVEFGKTVGLLIVAAAIGVGTFLGPLWAVTEYSAYSTRGKSELVSPATTGENGSGLAKEYAFGYSNGILEPMVLLVPNFYGGSTGDYLVRDQKSEVYTALSRSGDEQTANQLASYTSAYWGPQDGLTAPYYAGAIIVFLFALGIAFADKKYVLWLTIVAALGIILSWGKNFETFNYFLFDYLPGYNKFRSVTFTLVMFMFAAPLLGLLGLEKIMQKGLTKETKKKLLIAFASTGGVCLLLWLGAGMFGFIKEGEGQLPPWFVSALADDRKSLFRSDALRSFIFIGLAFVVIYFEVWNKISTVAFYAFLIAIVTLDLAVVDSRYLGKDNYQRKREDTFFAMTEADQAIAQDKGFYRVYNIQPGAFTSEAHTSYFHNSIGGYHGAKLRRYMDLYDSCLFNETNAFIQDAQAGKFDLEKRGVINMLNIKYLVYGPKRDNIIPNRAALGNAWFVDDVVTVNSPNEELAKTCSIDTRHTAVVDGSKFKVSPFTADSSATIALTEHTPNRLKYESQSQQNVFALFSEIYYANGWKATIDGKAADIVRANYVLRALAIPAGKHTVEFKFEPDAYITGNKITTASSWVMLLVLLGSLVWTLKEEKK